MGCLISYILYFFAPADAVSCKDPISRWHMQFKASQKSARLHEACTCDASRLSGRVQNRTAVATLLSQFGGIRACLLAWDCLIHDHHAVSRLSVIKITMSRGMQHSYDCQNKARKISYIANQANQHVFSTIVNKDTFLVPDKRGPLRNVVTRYGFPNAPLSFLETCRRKPM